MRTRVRIGGAALVLAFAVTAGAQVPKDDDRPLTDADFVKKAVSCGLAEVEMSKIAKDRATDPDVKKFAETIITDHTKVNEELAKIAKEANIPAPTKPEPEVPPSLSRLAAARVTGRMADSSATQRQPSSHAATSTR